jgi:Flp pilus assembly protein TadD
MIRVGEIIGASEIVYGDVRLGQTLEVTARTIHLSAGRRLPDVSDAARLDDLFTLFDRVAGRIAGGALPEAPGESSDGPVWTLDAFENFVKGLVASTSSAQRRFLELALADAPHDGRILTALWGAYTAEGDHELALGAANAVPSVDPESRRARFLVALSLIDLRRFDGAHQALSALAAERGAPAISNALGIVELRREPSDAAAAAAHFARAADAEPANTSYLFNRGYAHALAADGTSALYWLREAVRLDAADTDAHHLMGVVLQVEGRTVEARRELDLARELAGEVPPDHVPAGLERAVMGLDLPGVARAEAAIADPALRDQQATATFHLEQGRRLVESGRDREATGELRRAIYLAPYEDEPHLLLGGIYWRGGRLEEAIDELKVAIWCRETLAARLALGEMLFEHGDRAGARREAERALVLSPTSVAARDLLARASGGFVVPSTSTP